MALTDTKIRQAKSADKPIKLTDSNGLYIEIKPNGSKLWRYRYRLDGKENVFAIGEYPTISLADARKARDDARELVKKGINPAHARQSEKQHNIAEAANSFKVITMELVEQKKRKWSPSYTNKFVRFFQVNVFPYIGNAPIRSITPQSVLDVLRRIEKRGAIALALQIRQWISLVFRHAIILGKAEFDPAAALNGAIQRGTIEHACPLTRDEIGTFKARLQKYKGHRATVIALHLMLYLFPRTIELRKMEWKEILWDRREWHVSPEKMKMRRRHIVPLSNQAYALLQELHGITGSCRWAFPNMRHPTEIMSATTLNRALEYMGYQSSMFTAHDFRATASTHLYERGFTPDHIEAQLAHAEKSKTKRAYNHAEYLQDRHILMQAWADYLDSIPAVDSETGSRIRQVEKPKRKRLSKDDVERYAGSTLDR